MKTLMFEPPYGFAEYKIQNGNLEFGYSIRAYSEIEDKILKICLLSSKKPFNPPYIADTAEFKSGVAQNFKKISKSSLESFGYLPDDIDTVVAVEKKSDETWGKTELCGFDAIRWDTDGVFFKKEKVKSPVERGIEVLDKAKELTKSYNADLKLQWIKNIEIAVTKLKKADVSLPGGYDWYELSDIRPPVPLSAYRHIMYVTDVMICFEKYGCLYFGIGEDGHTAIAIRSGEFNPFINADDCAKAYKDYYVVGVYLADDGQYFEKPEL